MKKLKNQLCLVENFNFETLANKNTGWQGKGCGKVRTEMQPNGSLLFFEEGIFINHQSKGIRCSNVYRWRFHNEERRISLEHLRFGSERPVFLFDLVYENENTLVSASPHFCGADQYRAALGVDGESIHFHWHIQKKDSVYRLEYVYSL